MKRMLFYLSDNIMKISFFLVSLVITLSILCAWRDSYSTDYYYNILAVFGIIIFLAVVLYLTRRMTGEQFIFLLIVVTFITQFFWIIYSKVNPISDFKYMLNGAKYIADGNFSAVKADDYFFWFTTQLGYPVFQAIIIKFSNGSVIALQIVNSILVVGTIYLIYNIGKNCINETAGRIASLLYASYIGLFIMVPVLTNQHSSAFFIFLALNLMVHPGFRNKVKQNFLVGLSLAIGNILYPIGILYLISILLYIVFYLKSENREYSIYDKVKSFLIIIGGYFSAICIFSLLLITLGISDHGVMHYDNDWKFVLGLNQESNGQYSLADYKTVLPSILARDEKEHAKIEKKLIQERLEKPEEVIKLIKNKTLYMWGMPNDSYIYAGVYPVEKQQKQAIKVPYVRLESSQYFVISFFMLISSILLLITSKKLLNNGLNLYMIAMIGGMMIYFMIEIQIRYRYFFIPMMCLIASYSFSICWDKLLRVKKEW